MKKLLLTLLLTTSLSTFAQDEDIPPISRHPVDNDATNMEFCDDLQIRRGLVYIPNTDNPYTGHYKCIRNTARYSPNGEGEMVDGVVDGYWILYQFDFVNNENTDMNAWQSEGSYINGVKEGKWGYYELTELELRKWKEESYINGIRNGDYASWYTTSGQRHQVGTLKDGYLDGLWKTWHSNGELNSEKNYKDGGLSGLVEEYDSNGVLYLSENYKDGGVAHGSFKTWSNEVSGGRLNEYFLSRDLNYVNGELHGGQKIYEYYGFCNFSSCNYQNGDTRLIEYYVFDNGRKQFYATAGGQTYYDSEITIYKYNKNGKEEYRVEFISDRRKKDCEMNILVLRGNTYYPSGGMRCVLEETDSYEDENLKLKPFFDWFLELQLEIEQRIKG